MSATCCTCLRDGLAVVVPDDDCPAAIIHIIRPVREAEPA